MFEYVTIKLPREIIEMIDPILKKKGYSSRAEFVKEAIRMHLRTIETKTELEASANPN